MNLILTRQTMAWNKFLFFASFPLIFSIETFTLQGLPSQIDLEEMAQDFVLETKRIIIPEHPDAFNPSIIKWKGNILMVFRYRDNNGATHPMCLVELDQNFDVISPLYDVEILDDSLSSSAQDPRLLEIDGVLYIVYSNFVPIQDSTQRRVIVGQLHVEPQGCYVDHLEILTHFDGENGKIQEKNWMPFNYKGQLHLIYSVLPHRIFAPFFDASGSCSLIASSLSSIEWNWGPPRGGGQAYRIGNQYLAFFHSWIDICTIHSNGKKISHYFVGAYTFEAEPPFSVTSMSSKPIIGKGFYSGPLYQTWKPLRCVFPGGYIYNDKFIWLAYGKQDHELWIVKLDKKKLMKSLTSLTKIEK